MPQHTVKPGESRVDFMKRCQADGGTQDECVLRFEATNLSAGPPVFALDLPADIGFSASPDGKLYSKDILKVGHFVHPVTEQNLDVTPERLDHLLSAFNAMKANGVDVEVVVDHKDDAESIVGNTVSMERQNGTLVAVLDLKGERGTNLANSAKNVSVAIDRDFHDGKGRAYGEAIVHIAIVQQPVVSGQEAFIPLSRAGLSVKIPRLLLSNKPEEGKMEGLDKIRELIGAGDDIADDKLIEKLAEFHAGMKTNKEDLEKQVIDLAADLETAKTANLSTVDPKKVDVDPDTLQDLAEGAEAKMESLVTNGNVLPSVAAELSAILIGEDGKRNIMTLSRRASGKDELPLARRIINALSKNVALELVEKTSPQVLKMSGKPVDHSANKDNVNTLMQHSSVGIKTDSK